MGSESEMGSGEEQEPVVAAPAPKERRKRGRKPRRIIAQDSAGKPIYFSSLDIRLERFDDVEVLRLDGKLDTESIILLRDQAFTSIGAHPEEVCLDLRAVALPLDKHAMETLLTIGRVARLVDVRYSVILPSALEATWRETGLNRHIAIQSDLAYTNLPSSGIEENTTEVKEQRPDGVLMGGVI